MNALYVDLGLLIFASVILVKSATLLVRAISVIGKYLKISEFTIAFILMGIATSLPEISVAINAGLSQNSNLAFGNAIGSNITNLTLIVGIPTLVAGGLRVRSIIARKDTILMAVFATVPILLILDGTLSRTDGVILLVFYGMYLFRLLSQRSYFPDISDHITKNDAIYECIVFVLSVILLFASSNLLVSSSISLAEELKIPTLLIGLIIVSAGTSLPELTHGLQAIKLKHDSQVLGDILGSVVSNSTIVLAIAAIISPIQIHSFSTVLTSSFFLLFVIALFLIGVYTDKRLSVREAVVLFAIYFAFVITELGIQIVNKAVM